MRRVIAMIVLCAAPAFAGWGTWNQPWSTREIRSNLWCALEERVNAADVSAHITNTLAAPTFWVSKSWLDSWDAAMLNTLTNKYVDVTLLDGLTNNLTDPCYLTIGQAMTNIGYPQYAMMPTNGYWFPSYTNYLIRKLLVQEMKYTRTAATFIRLANDANNAAEYRSQWTNGLGVLVNVYTNTTDSEAFNRLEGVVTNNSSGGPYKFVSMVSWVYDATNDIPVRYYAYAQSRSAIASVESSTCGTNTAKTAALWLMAVEHPGTYISGEGDPGTAISRGFYAHGDTLTGSNAWDSAVSQASNILQGWTNTITIGGFSMGTAKPNPGPDIDGGEAVGWGYKLLGAWLLTWAFEYQ